MYLHVLQNPSGFVVFYNILLRKLNVGKALTILQLIQGKRNQWFIANIEQKAKCLVFIELRIPVDGRIPSLSGNPAEFNQVFMTIMTNAVQAIKGRGSITIRTYVKGDHIHVQIEDTGVGIPATKLNKLFDLSFSENGTRVKTGLGLFTAHHIVSKQKGEIHVASEVGKGSTFTVILPIG